MIRRGGFYGSTRSKWPGVVAGILALLLLQPRTLATTVSQDPLTGLGNLDLTATTAVVDTTQHEIRLPTLPSTVIFAPDGSNRYLAVRPDNVQEYLWTGTAMAAGATLSQPGLTPVAAAFLAEGTVAALGQSSWETYQWTGGGWTANSYLAVTGLQTAVSLAAGPPGVTVADVDGITSWSTDGTPMVDLTRTLAGMNALAATLVPDTPDIIAITQGPTGRTVTYYSYSGSGLVPNPYLSITGSSDPRAVVRGDDGTLYVLDGTQVQAYAWTGTSMAALVLSGITLTDPAALAVQPGTGDLVIVDGGAVRYFQRQSDGSYARQPTREAAVTDVPGYSPQRMAQSLAAAVPIAAGAVRVSAPISVPAGTSLQWWVSSNDGSTWVPASAGQWAIIPDGARGTSVLWRAQLNSATLVATPVIGAPITLETALPPQVTNLALTPAGDGWVTSLTPTATWILSDGDPGDKQSAKQILVWNCDTNQVIYNSGKISRLTAPAGPPDYSEAPTQANDQAGTMATFDIPAAVLQGTYRFSLWVRVWDDSDLISDWATLDFNVLAAGNLRITSIADPPPGQLGPPPDIIALPILVKAGAQFGVAADVLGPTGTTLTGAMVVNTDPATTLTWTAGTPPRWDTTACTDATVADGAQVYLTLTTTEPGGGVGTLGPVQVAGVLGSVLDDWIVVNTR